MVQTTTTTRSSDDSGAASSAAGSKTVTVFNLRLVVGTLVLAGTLLPAAYGWHKYQINRTVEAFVERANRLESEEDWAGAAQNLFRYLQIRPGDTEIQIRLAKTFDKSAKELTSNKDFQQKQRAIQLYQEAMGVVDDPAKRLPLRVRVGELSLDLAPHAGQMAGQYFASVEAEARAILGIPAKLDGDKERKDGQRKTTEAQVVLGTNEINPDGVRLLALARYGIFENGGSAALPQGKGTLTVYELAANALERNPGNVRLSVILATIYRDHEKLLNEEHRNLTKEDRARLADDVMNRLVAAKPDDVESLIARYEYRAKYDLPGASADLDDALERAPENLNAVLLKAGREGAKRDRESQELARELYEKAIVIDPSREFGYWGLAGVLSAQNRADEAIQALRDGLENANRESVELNHGLAELLLSRGKLKNAGEVLDLLDRVIRRLSTTQSRPVRLSLERRNNLLRARWFLASGETARAMPLLKLVTIGSVGTAAEATQVYQARALLGDSYKALGQWDLAAVAYEEAAALQPKFVPIRLAVANAWEKAGQAERAVQNYEQAKSLDDSAETRFLLARERFMQQVRLPENERNWKQFDDALATLDKPEDASESGDLKEPWRLELLKADYYSVLRKKSRDETGQDVPDPVDTLRKTEREFPDSLELLERLVPSYENLGHSQDADRAIDRFAELSENPVSPIILRSRLHRSRKQHDRATEVLRAGLGNVPSELMGFLERELVLAHLAAGDRDKAGCRLASLHKSDPSNVRFVIQMAELAVQGVDFVAIKLLDVSPEEIIENLEGPDGSHYQYFKARRLLSQLEKASDRKAVMKEVEELREAVLGKRPTWPQAHVLSGLLMQSQGKFSQAIDAYLEAIRLGSREVNVYRQLTLLLIAAGRFTDGAQVLAAIRGSASLSQVQGEALQDELTDAARRGVETRPEDPIGRMFLGQMLSSLDQREEAEAEFKRAVELAPGNIRTHEAMFFFFVRTKQLELAEQAIEQLAEKADVTDAQRALAVGRAQQALGKRKEAEASLLEAARLARDDAEVKKSVAFSLAQDNPAEAEKLFRELLESDSESGDVRQRLALVLVAQGGEDRMQEAIGLLDAGENGDTNSIADRRLQAVLLIQRQGLQNYARARRLLEELVENSDQTSDNDRLILASVCEQLGDFQAARRQFDTLVTRDDPNDAHLVALVDMLLRHSLLEEAEGWLKKLETTTATNLQTVALRARWLHESGRDSEIEPLVEGLAEELLGRPNVMEDKSLTAQIYANVGAIYSAVELNDASERWYRDLYESTSDQYERLAIAMGKKRKFEDAIRLCEAAYGAKSSPRPVIVLASSVLAANKATTEEARLAEPLLRKAADQHKDDPTLLLTLANLRVTQGNSEDAVSLYEQVLQLSPRNLLTLNNLATILSEIPGRREDALNYIDQAIDIGGERANFLDTKGAILVYLDRAEEAVPLLKESVAGLNPDPRFYLHLASAHDRVGDAENARKAFLEAIDGEVAEEILMEADQKLLDELIEKFATATANSTATSP